jgi:hypothetical protein
MSLELIKPGYALPEIIATPSPAAAMARVASIPTSASSYQLRKARGIINQHDLPCCVSSALSSSMEVLNSGWPQLAPLFHYYVTRHEWGGADSQGFLNLKTSLKTLDKVGICKYDSHPIAFDEAGSRTKPTPEAYADALTRAFGLIGEAKRFRVADGLSRSVWVRQQLRQDRAVIIGFQLPTGYPNKFLNSNFEWLNANVTFAGIGHCVLICGYNDLRQALCIQDCRGVSEFNKGYWWMGYLVADSEAVQEAYSLWR